ncbi:MAG: aminotransferase class V-fold PLP-dependent enzyme, partial [Myxococcota bacterium]
MSFSEAGVNFAGPLPERVYMDHNATTPLCPAARDAMTAALGVWGNPSSIHAEGRAARDWVERARRQVAQFLGSDSGDGIIFTSGGTEADCLGILGLAGLARRRGQPARVLSTAIEHPAVSGACAALVARGFAVHTVAVDGDGRIDREDFARHCRDGAALAVLSAANHELGTVQDVAGLAALAAEHGVLVHCDAVQAAGKIALTPATTGVASVALSGHKIYGPKG